MDAQRIYLRLQKEIEEAPIIPPCQTTDPELWFGINERQGLSQQSHFKEAKQLCSICPVAKTCLEYALEANETDGVWGGLAPHERKQMRAAAERNWKRRKRARKFA